MKRKENSIQSAFKKYQKKLILEKQMKKEKAFKFGEKEDGTEMYIGLDKIMKNLETHMQVIGPTGCGKSRLMDHLFRQLVINLPDSSFVLVDPKGDLYRSVLRFCPAHNLADRLVLFDPSEENIVGFNPLILKTGTTAVFQMNTVVNAIKAVWGQDTFNETPQMKRWLENCFFTLIYSNATFCEAPDIFSITDNWKRDFFVSKLGIGEEVSRIVKDEWINFSKLSVTKKKEDVNSSFARIRSFCMNPTIINILGRRKKVLSFRDITDKGKILLVNLERFKPLEEEQVYLLGTLLINDLVRETDSILSFLSF